MSSYRVTTILNRLHTFRYRLVLESVAVGVLAGGVVVLFRLVLAQMERLLALVTDYVSLHPWFLWVWGLCLLAAAGITTLLLRWEPMISGSGIPQLDGEIQGYFSQNWWRVLIAKFLGGIMTIGAGLSLGREGPSIQLGAMAGKGYARLTRRMRTEEKLLVTCGASAGLSAAFNAPIAGALFALEEVHKSFSVEVLLSALTASVASDFISRNIFGLRPVFDFSSAVAIPLSHFWIVVLLGIFLGLFGVLYNWSIQRIQKLYEKIPWQFVRTLIPFCLAGILIYVYPAVLGGGSQLVMQIAEGFPIGALLLLFILKFTFSSVSFGAGVPGGIFLPMLVLGAICGAVFHGIAAALGVDLNLLALVILGMAGAFAAIVRAPVTGILLITEMTGNFSHLLFIALVSLVAYAVADLMHARPIYDQLLRRMLLTRGKCQTAKDGEGEKVLIETSVCMGAAVCGKEVQEINLPSHCLIVSIRRGEREIVPHGETVVHAGDILAVLCDEFESAAVTYTMEKQCKALSV